MAIKITYTDSADIFPAAAIITLMLSFSIMLISEAVTLHTFNIYTVFYLIFGVLLIFGAVITFLLCFTYQSLIHEVKKHRQYHETQNS